MKSENKDIFCPDQGLVVPAEMVGHSPGSTISWASSSSYADAQFIALCENEDNMSILYISSYTPLLYGKTKSRVYRGIPIFLISELEHRLWVLVIKPPRLGCSNVYPKSYVFSNNKKKNFQLKFFNFYSFRKFYILHGHVFIEKRK